MVTIATRDRHRWFALHPKLADQATSLVVDLAQQRQAGLYAWCLMPDHVHLLLQDEDLVEFVRCFKGKLVPAARAIKSTRRLWQRSFHDHALRTDEALIQAAVYVWENPVRAGLVAEAQLYPWNGSSVWPSWRDGLREGQL